MWNKYCKKLHPIIAQGYGASHVWRKMTTVREEVEHNIWWQVASGTSSFWHDNWTKQGALYYIEGENDMDEELEVRSFCNNNGWDKQKLLTKISEEMTDYITECTKPSSDVQINDVPWWMENTQGRFTVKSA